MSKNVNKSDAVSTLVDPEQFIVDLGNGKKAEYVVSHVPSMRAQRILIALESSDPDEVSEAESDLLSYVAHNGVVLTNEGLVENHVASLRALLLLKEKMKEYNFGFFTEESFQREWEVLRPKRKEP